VADGVGGPARLAAVARERLQGWEDLPAAFQQTDPAPATARLPLYQETFVELEFLGEFGQSSAVEMGVSLAGALASMATHILLRGTFGIPRGSNPLRYLKL